jgi:hypothetical protein
VCPSIKTKLARINRERNNSIHVFIIGLDVEDDEAREQCKSLCEVSKLSFYTDATIETIDTTFDAVAAAISGQPVSYGFLRGLTMEMF